MSNVSKLFTCFDISSAMSSYFSNPHPYVLIAFTERGRERENN